jgi:predicted O-methyltransferase YrrM
MAVEGQISRSEAAKLMELARSARSGKVIVEIGSYRGRSTLALAFGSLQGNNSRIYAVDPHLPFVGVFGGKFGPNDQRALYLNLVKAGVGHLVFIVSLHSLTAAKGWPHQDIDLLWIDGDHRYEAVRGDYNGWYPHVAIGGVIAFHDNDAEGIRAIINEITDAEQVRSLGQVDTLSWFEKRELNRLQSDSLRERSVC